MPIPFPPLPFPLDSLAPAMSAVEGRLTALQEREEARADVGRQAGGQGMEPWFIA